MDTKNHILWTYQDTNSNPNGLFVYTVTRPQRDPVSKIRISTTYKRPSESFMGLHVCEVELYGECLPGFWGLECRQTCPTECPTWCQQDTGTCLSCVGYSDPPDCITACKPGTWGRNCLKTCSPNCKDHICDAVTGLCDLKCDSRTDLSCPADCPVGYHGSNCSLQCSRTCKNMSCNKLGYCVTCLPGHTGVYCENGPVV
nr:multiple epidermal growth factor-like domains protein 10; partial [Biomphalaria glabrata]